MYFHRNNIGHWREINIFEWITIDTGMLIHPLMYEGESLAVKAPDGIVSVYIT